jgi:hypothetical protein
MPGQAQMLRFTFLCKSRGRLWYNDANLPIVSHTPMHRALFLLAAVLLLAAGVVGCDPAPAAVTPTPVVDARGTAVAERQVAEQTLAAITNATTTVTTAAFARVKPLLEVQLKDAGAAGAAGTRVQILVRNGDETRHQVAIRLYDGTDPLNSEQYRVGVLEVEAANSATTTLTTTVPFAVLASQVLQIDGVWDFSPPPPMQP